MADHRPKRPIERSEIRGRSIWRIPEIGPVTPRLREPALKDAIGFWMPDRPADDEDGG